MQLLRDNLTSWTPDFIAEFSDGDARSKAPEHASLAHEEALNVAEKDLVVTHPNRVGLTLRYSDSQRGRLNDPRDACELACTFFEGAEVELEASTLFMQFLRDKSDSDNNEQGCREYALGR